MPNAWPPGGACWGRARSANEEHRKQQHSPFDAASPNLAAPHKSVPSRHRKEPSPWLCPAGGQLSLVSQTWLALGVERTGWDGQAAMRARFGQAALKWLAVADGGERGNR